MIVLYPLIRDTRGGEVVGTKGLVEEAALVTKDAWLDQEHPGKPGGLTLH
jgi:hypothetical protein